MRVRIVGFDRAGGKDVTVVSRHDSQGRVHYTEFLTEQASLADRICQWASMDSVQVTSDGRFKMGDWVRPTRRYIEECCHGSIPYEMAEQWGRGFRITEIGPDGFPWAGAHAIEIEGGDLLMLDSTSIEMVRPA